MSFSLNHLGKISKSTIYSINRSTWNTNANERDPEVTVGGKFNVSWQSEEASLRHMTQEEREQGDPSSPPREVVSPTTKPGSWDYIIKVREKWGLGREAGGKVKALAK